ncbi:PP2C family protein-serine/threonine phosphatase [Streptomyces sp. NPDC003023]|uniref:PP2C family protein-serine/threonine phosphatase n=1 Tax=Streptomyces sp. NPDC003023 TaxID=3364675 RepID=UPI00368A001E
MAQRQPDGSDRPVAGAVPPPPTQEDYLDQIQVGLPQVAHDHERVQELLGAVLAISKELELDSVLHTINEAARQLAGARYAALGVLDDSGEFTDLISAGFGRDQHAALGDAMPHGRGLLGDVVRDPQPLRVARVAGHPHAVGFPRGHPLMTTLLGVPIRVRDKLYGTLFLADRKGGGSFTDDDENIVVALAGAAGVAIENARLYEQLRQATEDFQRRLLPRMPRREDLELEARYQPSTEAPRIGGDWYDLIRLPGRVPCLMVGDVMGHGLEAATVMSQISNMLRVIAFEEEEPPSRILRRLDEVLQELHGGPMATVIVARLEPSGRGKELRWASAGHLPPLLVTPDHRARYLETDTGPPLGVDPAIPRRDHSALLPPGSTLLLHTDGLVEHRGKSIDEGMAAAIGVAAVRASTPLPELCDALLAHGHDPFHDDVALLAARLAA